jgi:hypothetical protein
LFTKVVSFRTLELARLKNLFVLVEWGRLMRVTLVSKSSLTLSDLIIREVCKRTNKLDWRSESSISIYVVSFVKVKLESHVFLVVCVQRLEIFLKI